MTAHGPAAVAIVRAALDEAGVGPDLPTGALYDLTGQAYAVRAGWSPRDDAIDLLAATYDLARPFTAKALDVAVEALTATQE